MKSMKDLLPEEMGQTKTITPQDFEEIDQGVKQEEQAAPTQPNYTQKIVAPNLKASVEIPKEVLRLFKTMEVAHLENFKVEKDLGEYSVVSTPSEFGRAYYLSSNKEPHLGVRLSGTAWLKGHIESMKQAGKNLK